MSAAFTPGLVAAADAIAAAWDAAKGAGHALPPIEFTKGERLYLAEAAIKASGAPHLYEAASLWAEYDSLLRKYTGPQTILFDGDVPELDAAYDKARDATFAALAKARGDQ